MSFNTVALYARFLLIVLALVKPLGGYMTRVFAGETTMSYTSQLVGLVAQNFLAGAGG